MTDTPIKPATVPVGATKPETRQPWLWNVVLLNDEHHSYEYVIHMAQRLFGHPVEKAFRLALRVDEHGRAVCLTTHKEHAELKRDQILAFGRDKLVAECQGSMSAIIEPAAGDDADGDRGGDDNRPT